MSWVGRKRWIALCAALVACGGPGAGEPTTPRGMLHGDPEGAVDACREALSRGRELGASERQAVTSSGCADLFSLPLCAEAVRMSSQAGPELRGLLISLPCQRSYCEMLPEPRPLLCALDVGTAEPEAVSSAWRSFVPAVLELELGLAEESPTTTLLVLGLGELVPAPARAIAAGSRPRAPADQPEAHLVVRVARRGSEFVIGARLGETRHFGPWTQPLAPDAGDFAGLLEASLREAAGAPTVVEAAAEVPRDVVAQLLDALWESGVAEVSVSPLGDGEDQNESSAPESR